MKSLKFERNQNQRKLNSAKASEERKKQASAKARARQPQRPQQCIYQVSDAILLVGEGNFSFALSLAKRLTKEAEHNLDLALDNYDAADAFDEDGNELIPLPTLCKLRMTATTLDTREIMMEKYSDASVNVESLIELGVIVHYGVDATNLHKFKWAAITSFDRIIFNFPHVGKGIKNQQFNIVANQTLLEQFFHSCSQVMHEKSQVHVSLKCGEPYDLWRVKFLARSYFTLHQSTKFDIAMYPEYAHRRTLGFSEGKSADNNEELRGKECRTYCFALKNDEVAETKSAEKPIVKSGTKPGKRTSRSEKRKAAAMSSDEED